MPDFPSAQAWDEPIGPAGMSALGQKRAFTGTELKLPPHDYKRGHAYADCAVTAFKGLILAISFATRRFASSISKAFCRRRK